MPFNVCNSVSETCSPVRLGFAYSVNLGFANWQEGTHCVTHYSILLDTPLHIMTTCLLFGVYQLSPDVSSFQESLWLLKMKNRAFISFPMWVLQGRDLGLRLFGGFGWYHAPPRSCCVSACAHANTSGSSSQGCPSGPVAVIYINSSTTADPALELGEAEAHIVPPSFGENNALPNDASHWKWLLASSHTSGRNVQCLKALIK